MAAALFESADSTTAMAAIGIMNASKALPFAAVAPALLLMYFDSRCGSTIVRLQSLARDATTATLILEVKESDFALGKPRHGPSVPGSRTTGPEAPSHDNTNVNEGRAPSASGWGVVCCGQEPSPAQAATVAPAALTLLFAPPLARQTPSNRRSDQPPPPTADPKARSFISKPPSAALTAPRQSPAFDFEAKRISRASAPHPEERSSHPSARSLGSGPRDPLQAVQQQVRAVSNE
ncbi:hypothetical protein PHYSODRAFT_338615 [Phytophthora sojae]|uniref:Uncharacterized protein n=1 Tax=Phytophthora sojae (strain P6497) TaxID=1094619 RepID=G5A2L1_PHYSP|nr:hypothetical protein PHYSODRAFT_338615 [Phytophthora sojae]EGZ09901.1 hypothetical protein PHYSODRAFT_338615 [Phytophthora sojae]|eukprot:XP_009534762.1 hypothetical protein PHYSODRAFT_338615 [Phytophthora sojae]